MLEQVALAGALAEHLAGAGDLEALAGTAVRLVLRHSAVLSSSVAFRCPVVKPGTVERRWYRLSAGLASPRVTPRRKPRQGPRRRPAASTSLLAVGALGVGVRGVLRRRGRPSPRPCGPPAPAGLGHGLGLLLVRTENHDHVPAVLLRVRLDEAEVLRRPSARRCSSRKPSSGRDCSRPRNMIVILTLSPCLEEPDDVTLFGVVVVRVDLRPELHFLDDRVRLVLARLTGLHGRLVLELPVVHELADRRAGARAPPRPGRGRTPAQAPGPWPAARCRPARHWDRQVALRERESGR